MYKLWLYFTGIFPTFMLLHAPKKYARRFALALDLDIHGDLLQFKSNDGKKRYTFYYENNKFKRI